MLGGKDSKSVRIDTIDIFDPKAGEWINMPDIKMRKPKSGFASVYVKHTSKKAEVLMVIGGNDGQVQNRVEYLNLSDM